MLRNAKNKILMLYLPSRPREGKIKGKLLPTVFLKIGHHGAGVFVNELLSENDILLP